MHIQHKERITRTRSGLALREPVSGFRYGMPIPRLMPNSAAEKLAQCRPNSARNGIEPRVA